MCARPLHGLQHAMTARGDPARTSACRSARLCSSLMYSIPATRGDPVLDCKIIYTPTVLYCECNFSLRQSGQYTPVGGVGSQLAPRSLHFRAAVCRVSPRNAVPPCERDFGVASHVTQERPRLSGFLFDRSSSRLRRCGDRLESGFDIVADGRRRFGGFKALGAVTVRVD